MKFLILGCNGMAGHMVSTYLIENGHNVTGLARNKWRRGVDTIICDVTDFDLLQSIINTGNYDAIINCVGILNQFAESDHPLAVLINGYLPHYLAKITEEMATQVIHISTDCVFSGENGAYSENAIPDARTFYGRTKAMGELNDKKNITLRTSIVGPDIKQSGIGLLNWFMQQEKEVYGFVASIWTGQTTLQLAKTIEKVAGKAHGLYNAVPAVPINKCDLLNCFNKYILHNKVEVVPTFGIKTNKSLIRTRYDGFNYEIPNYETMIDELGIWMRNHRDFYPHYRNL